MGNEISAPVSYGTKLRNDVNVEWKKVEMDVKLPSRDGHCAAAIANKLYIFGGVRWLSDIGEVTESNEILLFDVGKIIFFFNIVLISKSVYATSSRVIRIMRINSRTPQQLVISHNV